MKLGILLVTAFGLCPGQVPPSLTNEDGNWSQVTHGAFPCAIRGQLKVSATGGIVLRGTSRDDCGFRIRQSARASSETQARYRLRGYSSRSRVIVDTSILTVVPAEGSTARLEIELWIPRTMKEASLITQGGRVQATDFDGSVSVESGGGPIEIDRLGGAAALQTSGGTIRVGHVNGSVRGYSGGGSIRVDHSGGDVWADTAGGDIVIGQVTGTLHVTTAGGNIGVERAFSTVFARSMSGLIDIQDAGGRVTAVAMGGSIQVGAARQGAICEASSGTIRVKALEGPLRLSTAMGNVLAQLVSSRTFADSYLNSDSGDVTVSIPADFPVSVIAKNETPGNRGLIVSEFPQVRVVQSGGGMYPVKAEGALNGGGPTLRVSTGRGRIYLLRQK
jgi:hypothetical protein